MIIKRRHIIFCVLLITCVTHTHAQSTLHINKFLRSNFGTDTMWNGDTVRVFGIADYLMDDPHIPASVVYCNEGDSVIINALSISQYDHHTIHLHGLDVDTRNDGDPATSFYLEHMQDTTYSFRADHAGIYFYHCHMADAIHVQMGMYGLLVVKAAGGVNTAYTGGPSFHRSYNWVISEIDTFWHRHVPVHDDVADTSRLPGKYVPSYFLINGHSETQLETDDSTSITGKEGEFIYIRIGNIGFFRNIIIFPEWLNAIIIDSDGRPLPEQIESDTLEISPGERYGIMLNPSAQLEDVIPVQFVDMNTNAIRSTQNIPVDISGVVATEDITNTKINVYPNPTNGKIQVTGLENKKAYIQINNLNGKTVKTFVVNTADPYLNCEDLAPGYYELTITQDGKTISFPFVIQ